MPKRLKCCDPHCGQNICTPTEKADWFYNWTGAQTYETDACAGGMVGEGDCSAELTFDFDFDGGLGCVFDDPSLCDSGDPSCSCRTWNNFAGHFAWDDVGGDSNSYQKQWTDCDGQGYTCSPNCSTGAVMMYCFGNQCGQSGGCEEGSSGLFSGCSEIASGYATVYTSTSMNTCSNTLDATWYASGFKIHGNINLFDPDLSADQCDNYKTMIRRITLQGTNGSASAACRVTWYFSGNPITGGTVETCYYHDYSGTVGNEFGDTETWWDYQTQWGLYGSGGSTKLHLTARIGDGDNSVIHDITNDSVEIQYRKPRKYRRGLSLLWDNQCGGTETPALNCDDDYCCDDLCTCWAIGFGWNSPYVQVLTSDDATEEFDNCPNGSKFGGAWTPISSTYFVDRGGVIS